MARYSPSTPMARVLRLLVSHQLFTFKRWSLSVGRFDFIGQHPVWDGGCRRAEPFGSSVRDLVNLNVATTAINRNLHGWQQNRSFLADESL